MLTVSDTAYAVATIRADETRLPASERLHEDPYAAIFRSGEAAVAEATARMLGLPFMRDGVRLRTRFVDDFVRDALAAGLTQVVLLGAGFDARALRMPEIPERGARVYEVDFAALLEHKLSLLRAAGVPVPAHLAQVPCDLMNPAFEPALAAGLEARGFRRGAGAAFVWEGVVGYLDDPAIDRSLRFMASAGGPGTRVVFEYGDGRFDPVPIAAFTRRAGFTAFEEVAGDAVWRRYLPGEPHPYASSLRLGVARV